ncbi:alpha-2-macroglobulin family protein [Mucilaginibacter mallensis]|nr:alpha-2-macroglobulin family protein [Mucilaginibacter mallensis]
MLITGLLFFITNARAQDKYQTISNRIDSLAGVGLPKSALKEVDELEKLARQNKNTPQQIKAVIYRMTFQSYLEENAYPAIISRLKKDVQQAKYPAKPVLQSLLAEMYWKYYDQNRYRFTQRSQLLKPDTDFNKWDLKTIINETSGLYKLSLADARQEQATPITVLDGVLQGDTATRYLRPTLYDMLVQRAFDFYLSDEPALTKPRLPFSLNDAAFFGDSRTFAALPVKTTDTASTYYQSIKYLQQATNFHLQMHQGEALADIDLQRLKFLYSKSTVNHKDSLYLSALKQIATTFAKKPISAEALVLQGQYYQGLDSLTIAYNYFKQAVSAYPQSLGGKNAAVLMKGIEQKEISATVENINMPGKPLLALLTYKNITSANVLVYRLSAAQLQDYNTGDTISTLPKYRINLLKKLKAVQNQDLKWTDPGDFRGHSVEFKLGALAAGNYVLLIKDGASDDETLTGLADFRISSLAYTARKNPDNNIEIRVMDRETGKPLSGVQVSINAKVSTYDNKAKNTYWTDLNDSGNTDRDGKFISTKYARMNGLSIKFIFKGDTLSEQSKYINGAEDRTDNDDEPEDKTVLFTDRQIYRSGQTIYFKGLQLQTLKGKSKIMPGKAEEVDFMDVNNKQVSSLQLTTNEFGSFSGSFIIPQSMLNGEVRIKTADGDINVQVEEYKRPTFQVEFLRVKESYKLNDSVTVKGKVTAFSGYGLSQARVTYHITRSQNIRFMPYKRGVPYRYNYNNPTTEIKADTILTDNQGNYSIKFKAIPGESASAENYNYTINADVTDESDETHSGQTTVTIGNNDIKIIDNIPARAFAKDTYKVPVSISNLNNQPEKGEIKVEIYALKNPDQLFINRLWTTPDKYLLSKADFKANFPDYAYGNEDNEATWPRAQLISSVNLKTDTGKRDSISLDQLRKQASGIYQVVISARNEKGDTTSITKYVTLMADPPKASNTNEWVVPVLNSVKPGSNAEFLVGLNQKINVLMEYYNGAKLISSKWITIDNGQQNIKVPVAAADKNPAVQFLTVYHNRIYSSYQKIYITNPDNNLKVKFLTFNNKLEPGQAEQWKLQVSGANNEKLATEMVASLYDASLDDIAPSQNWSHALDPSQKYQPNYFAWNSYEFVNALNTMPVSYANFNYSTISRDYEQLNLFGYDYYGNYNNGYRQYQQRLQADNELREDYLKNAQLVKNGYDISGYVREGSGGPGLAGASVTIKGTSIATTTNSVGYFKIRVPINGTLVFTYVGYLKQEIATSKTGILNLKLAQDGSGLNEVVVVGYGVQKSIVVNGPVGNANKIMIRGTSSQLAEVALNGKVAGVQVVNDYGDQAFKADTSEFKASPYKQRQPIIRKNFNETAFFYPQLRTNDKGEILIDFIIPQSLTKWRFEAFAHTQQLQTGYIENEIVTQKQLSINANMPRFLREGDTLTVSARLANLTAGDLKGKVTIQLFNALTMQPVNLLLNPADSTKQVEIGANMNKGVSFKLVVPQGLDALTYRLTADAGNYSDGEENTLPVLPNRMLVTESMPMMVRAGKTSDYTFDKLINNTSTTLKSKTLTLEYTQNPAWYAVQALPYMMEFPYECSEQVFSRYYANSLATSLVNHMPVIKRVFDQWKNTNSTELLSNLEKNQDLKSTLLEETPWLQDAANESEQKKRIALLFDLNKMSNEMQLNLDKLQKRQLPDGGFTWFAGDQADRYITQHIIAGIGQLFHLNIATEKDQELKEISDKAIQYLDDQLVTDDKAAKKLPRYETRGLGSTEIHAWYALSYYTGKQMSTAVKSAFNNYLNRAAKQWVSQSIYEQGLIALTMQRNGKPLVAQAIIKSLKETAQQSDDLGMCWARNTYGYFWYQSPIETQSLMIELFTEAGNNQKSVEEMKIWLLRSKQTSDWKTTKATAAACYALLMKQDDWLSPNSSSAITLGGKPLEELKPDIKADAGTGYIKTSWADEQIKPAYGKVEIKNNGKSISWGALHWQYLEQLDKITPSKTDIHIDRKYFIVKQTDGGPVLTAVDATHQPKTGDLLKVVVYLQSGRDFEYVQLKDMRPAGTEPVDALSAYKYQDGLYYYQVTKDVATNFFISYLKKGNYVFEYQLRVAQPGDFSTGIATVQSMYAPEFNAHSEGERIIFTAPKAL